MNTPTPIGEMIAKVHLAPRLDEAITRRCVARSCQREFRTHWLQRRFCDECCRAAGKSYAPPVQYYQPPQAYRGYALSPAVHAAAQESWLLVLTGPTGTGKTCQAHWLLAHHPASRAMLQAAGTLGHDWQEPETRRALLSIPVLALDDVARRLTDGVVEALCLLLDHRGSHGLQTVCTTNLTRDQIDTASPPLASRLGAGRWLHVGGVDRRAPR